MRLTLNRKTITVIVLVLAVLHFVWGYTYLTTSGILSGEPKYISDECWYVSAARNMLRKIFGLTPNSCINGLCYASVFVNGAEVKDKVEEFIRANGGVIVKDDYSHRVLAGYEYTIAFKAPMNVIKALENNYTVIIGYPYPDWDDVANYLNLEHPPLGKYFIMLAMLISDTPLVWKIPSLIAGSLIIVFVYLVSRKVFGEYAGLLAAGIAFVEPVIRAMSMVAMLDIYVALFTVISLYFAVKAAYTLSSINVGLAGSSKINGFTNVISIILSSWRNKQVSNLRLAVYVFVIPLLVYFMVSIPIIVYEGGITEWIDLQLWALSWHTQSRPPGGPPVANPWDWFIARNSFPLHYSPNLSASPSPPLMLLTIPLTIILVPLALKNKVRGAGTIISWFWIPIAMFTFLFILGNRTQYSFYSAQVTPIAAIIASSTVYLVYNKNLVLYSLRRYIEDPWYRIPAFSTLGLILWVIIAYVVPGGLGFLLASIVLGVIVYYIVQDVVRKLVMGAGLGVLAPSLVYVYYYIIAGQSTAAFFYKMMPYPVLPLIISAIITVTVVAALTLITYSVEEEAHQYGTSLR